VDFIKSSLIFMVFLFDCFLMEKEVVAFLLLFLLSDDQATQHNEVRAV